MDNLNDDSGQTSVEYILMIAVMSVIAMSLFGKLEGYLLTNPDSILNNMLGSIKSTFAGGYGNFAYKRFGLLR